MTATITNNFPTPTTIQRLEFESWTEFHNAYLTYANQGGTKTKAQFFRQTWVNGWIDTIPSIHGNIEQYWKFAPEVDQFDVDDWL